MGAEYERADLELCHHLLPSVSPHSARTRAVRRRSYTYSRTLLAQAAARGAWRARVHGCACVEKSFEHIYNSSRILLATALGTLTYSVSSSSIRVETIWLSDICVLAFALLSGSRLFLLREALQRDLTALGLLWTGEGREGSHWPDLPN